MKPLAITSRRLLIFILIALWTLPARGDTDIPGPDTEAYAIRAKRNIKDWTFLVYMAADNNLSYFAQGNIKQMASIGTNDWINIVVQINEPGRQNPTQRYLIEKNRAALLNADQVNAGKKLDTGNPQTLIDFCTESIAQFPARHLAIILWNHGTGVLDPFSAKTCNVSELFQLNPSDMMLELNREGQSPILQGRRGICFDETYHSYLTNQKLNFALNAICTKIGRKFDIIGLDACMMQMVEFCSLIKPYANIAVGSQEVELGAGWNYKSVLGLFTQPNIAPIDLAKHITDCYQRAYSRLTHDYTLSAVNLTSLNKLEENLDAVGTLLTTCLKNQTDLSVKHTLDFCRSRDNCTCFDEPSYLDLGHLYRNILDNVAHFKVRNDQSINSKLQQKLQEGLRILQEVVIARVAGKNLAQATGLSIYFPATRPHSSYAQVPFARDNAWGKFIYEYLQKRPLSTITIDAPSMDIPPSWAAVTTARA